MLWPEIWGNRELDVLFRLLHRARTHKPELIEGLLIKISMVISISNEVSLSINSSMQALGDQGSRHP